MDLRKIQEIRGKDIKMTESWRRKHLHLRKNYDIEELYNVPYSDIAIDRHFLRAHENITKKQLETDKFPTYVPVCTSLCKSESYEERK